MVMNIELLRQKIMKMDSMQRFEKYLYYLLTGYLVFVIVAAQFLVKITIHQAVGVFALPFLGWLILTAYYLVKWSGQRMGWLHKEAPHHPERQPAKASSVSSCYLLG